MSDTDNGGELDFSLSYSRGASLLGHDFGLIAGIGSVESSLGDREEIFAGLSYTWIADLTATVWHETENDWLGVELGASYDITTPVTQLQISFLFQLKPPSIITILKDLLSRLMKSGSSEQELHLSSNLTFLKKRHEKPPARGAFFVSRVNK